MGFGCMFILWVSRAEKQRVYISGKIYLRDAFDMRHFFEMTARCYMDTQSRGLGAREIRVKRKIQHHSALKLEKAT